MSFSSGDLFHIEMRSGIYQVLGVYGADDKGGIYYFRKVFDGKYNLKVSKAEVVHESWMTPISPKTRAKLSPTIDLPQTREVLNDLTIDRMMTFGTSGRMEVHLCTMDPRDKKKIEKQLNSEINGWVNPFLLRNAIRELQEQGVLHIETALEDPAEGRRLYRIELGRYCDDFDEFGCEQFREIRFYEIKMYKREDIV